jgi:predicted glycosyltransferase
LFKKPYYLIRVSGKEAHHDPGISGLNYTLISKITRILETKGDVYISSENTLNDQLEPYLLKTNPTAMQQILYGAEMLISDSQSMSMEAAMLGVPSIRYSDFAGRISVLEELEHVYRLTFGIKPDSSNKLFEKITEFLSLPDLRNEFEIRRQEMLKDKIDVTAFLVWFISSFPESVKTMKENPEYQNRFKN